MDAVADEIMDETPEVSESDKDRNFRLLREKVAALEAELAELRPLRTGQRLRDAGFDPATPVGKAVGLLMQAQPDAVPDDVDKFREWVSTELGFAPTETGKVEAAVGFADRLDQLGSAATSERPRSLADEIADAEKAGQWGLVARLKTRQALQS